MVKYGDPDRIRKLEQAAGIIPPAPTRSNTGQGPGKILNPGAWTGEKREVYRRGKRYPLNDIPLIPRAKGGPVSPSKPKVMKAKGMRLAGFAPGPKKSKKTKKRFPA